MLGVLYLFVARVLLVDRRGEYGSQSSSVGPQVGDGGVRARPWRDEEGGGVDGDSMSRRPSNLGFVGFLLWPRLLPHQSLYTACNCELASGSRTVRLATAPARVCADCRCVVARWPQDRGNCFLAAIEPIALPIQFSVLLLPSLCVRRVLSSPKLFVAIFLSLQAPTPTAPKLLQVRMIPSNKVVRLGDNVSNARWSDQSKLRGLWYR